MNPRFDFDIAIAGRRVVVGADEAGRGCLAGPLVAAAVCLDYRAMGPADMAALDGLDDSKKLNGDCRARLYAEVLRRARHVVVVSCSPGTVDRRGLHASNLSSLGLAVSAVMPSPDVVLVDGFELRGCRQPHRPVIGGDGRSAAIAAASVVAKVTRDRVMQRLHERYPQYGFDRHVGYATRQHLDAIARYGVCPLHRLSFASVAYEQLRLDRCEGDVHGDV